MRGQQGRGGGNRGWGRGWGLPEKKTGHWSFLVHRLQPTKTNQHVSRAIILHEHGVICLLKEAKLGNFQVCYMCFRTGRKVMFLHYISFLCKIQITEALLTIILKMGALWFFFLITQCSSPMQLSWSEESVCNELTQVFPGGGNGLSTVAPKRKIKLPRTSKYLFHILCGYLDEITLGVAYLQHRRMVSRQSARVQEWLPPENIWSHHFEICFD